MTVSEDASDGAAVPDAETPTAFAAGPAWLVLNLLDELVSAPDPQHARTADEIEPTSACRRLYESILVPGTLGVETLLVDEARERGSVPLLRSRLAGALVRGGVDDVDARHAAASAALDVDPDRGVLAVRHDGFASIGTLHGRSLVIVDGPDGLTDVVEIDWEPVP